MKDKLKPAVIIRYDEEDGIYVCQFLGLRGCMTHGRTPMQALKRGMDVKDEWLKEAKEQDFDMDTIKKMVNTGNDFDNEYLDTLT